MAQMVAAQESSSRLALELLDDSLRRMAEEVHRLDRCCAEVRAACQRLTGVAADLRWRASDSDSGYGRLTRRERLVAALAAEGKTNSQISTELHVSLHTIKSQMRCVLRKLEISSRWQLATSGVGVTFRSGEGPEAPQPWRGGLEQVREAMTEEPDTSRLPIGGEEGTEFVFRE